MWNYRLVDGIKVYSAVAALSITPLLHVFSKVGTVWPSESVDTSGCKNLPLCQEVRRNGRQNQVYYHCSKYFRFWAEEPCNYRKFIPGTWDDLVWGGIYTWLRDDAWVEQQLLSEQSQDKNTTKLIRLQRFKITQARARIAKVQEEFEGGIYSLDEVERRIADHHQSIARAEREIERLKEGMNASIIGKADIQDMRMELKALRDRNLDKATFEEKMDIISKLGIRVHPSEDLKSMRVLCQPNLEQVQSDNGSGRIETREPQTNGERESATECRKVMFGLLCR